MALKTYTGIIEHSGQVVPGMTFSLQSNVSPDGYGMGNVGGARVHHGFYHNGKTYFGQSVVQSDPAVACYPYIVGVDHSDDSVTVSAISTDHVGDDIGHDYHMKVGFHESGGNWYAFQERNHGDNVNFWVSDTPSDLNGTWTKHDQSPNYLISYPQIYERAGNKQAMLFRTTENIANNTFYSLNIALSDTTMAGWNTRYYMVERGGTGATRLYPWRIGGPNKAQYGEWTFVGFSPRNDATNSYHKHCAFKFKTADLENFGTSGLDLYDLSGNLIINIDGTALGMWENGGVDGWENYVFHNENDVNVSSGFPEYLLDANGTLYCYLRTTGGSTVNQKLYKHTLNGVGWEVTNTDLPIRTALAPNTSRFQTQSGVFTYNNEYYFSTTWNADRDYWSVFKATNGADPFTLVAEGNQPPEEETVTGGTGAWMAWADNVDDIIGNNVYGMRMHSDGQNSTSPTRDYWIVKINKTSL